MGSPEFLSHLHSWIYLIDIIYPVSHLNLFAKTTIILFAGLSYMTPRQTASTSGIKASFLLLSSFSVKLVWIQVSTTWRWRWPPRRRDRSGSAGHIISDQSNSQDPLLYEIKIVVRIQGEIWKIRNAISSISNPPKRRNRWWLFKNVSTNATKYFQVSAFRTAEQPNAWQLRR